MDQVSRGSNEESKEAAKDSSKTQVVSIHMNVGQVQQDRGVNQENQGHWMPGGFRDTNQGQRTYRKGSIVGLIKMTAEICGRVPHHYNLHGQVQIAGVRCHV